LFAVVVIALAAGAPAPAGAQGSPTGTLTGTISDPSGGVLPGVTVVARGVQTGLTQQTISGGAGDWRIPALPVGAYEVSFELQGFKKLVRSGVTVEAAVTRSLHVTLAVGGLSETIQVAADAALLTVTTPTTSRSLSGAELEIIRHRLAVSRICSRQKLASAPISPRCSSTAPATSRRR
jgi:hypothetical protein